ncbi:MAG: hypothetical protein IPG97_15480 [Microthrixaceae bacterium]|nr:hypothetical protein [Microthrixaceae bacterium]
MHFLEVDHIEVHNAFIEVLNSGDWCWALQELGFCRAASPRGGDVAAGRPRPHSTA